MLDNAWKGYNCSLFAYGQTGSGKSYSMVGYGANKGIVPVTCEQLFTAIEEKQGSGTEFQVVFSMLEIYNEQVKFLVAAMKELKLLILQVHDLLNPSSVKGGGLKIRENPKRGFYGEHSHSYLIKKISKLVAAFSAIFFKLLAQISNFVFLQWRS